METRDPPGADKRPYIIEAAIGRAFETPLTKVFTDFHAKVQEDCQALAATIRKKVDEAIRVSPSEPAAPLPDRRAPGPKPGRHQDFLRVAWNIAEPILLDPQRRPIKGRKGKTNLSRLAALIKPALERAGYDHAVATIEHGLRGQVRAWEADNLKTG